MLYFCTIVFVVNQFTLHFHNFSFFFQFISFQYFLRYFRHFFFGVGVLQYRNRTPNFTNLSFILRIFRFKLDFSCKLVFTLFIYGTIRVFIFKLCLTCSCFSSLLFNIQINYTFSWYAICMVKRPISILSE